MFPINGPKWGPKFTITVLRSDTFLSYGSLLSLANQLIQAKSRRFLFNNLSLILYVAIRNRTSCKLQCCGLLFDNVILLMTSSAQLDVGGGKGASISQTLFLSQFNLQSEFKDRFTHTERALINLSFSEFTLCR